MGSITAETLPKMFTQLVRVEQELLFLQLAAPIKAAATSPTAGLRAFGCFLPSPTSFCDSLRTRKMYAAVILLVFVFLTAAADADHHHHQQPCHLPNVTGIMNVMDMKDPVKALGVFTYDSTDNKLRFKSNENFPNASRYLDLLMFFEEGIMYEINSKNQSCEKKKLQYNYHTLRIPEDAHFLSTMTLGNPSIVGDGLEFSMWEGSMPDKTGKYVISVTKGCLPMSSIYYRGSTTVLFSLLNLESEIKNPEVLEVPSFCEGLPVSGTVNGFLDVFM